MKHVGTPCNATNKHGKMGQRASRLADRDTQPDGQCHLLGWQRSAAAPQHAGTNLHAAPPVTPSGRSVESWRRRLFAIARAMDCVQIQGQGKIRLSSQLMESMGPGMNGLGWLLGKAAAGENEQDTGRPKTHVSVPRLSARGTSGRACPMPVLVWRGSFGANGTKARAASEHFRLRRPSVRLVFLDLSSLRVIQRFYVPTRTYTTRLGG